MTEDPNLPEFDEADALRRAKAGHADGWSALHARYYRGLWAAVHSVVRDDASAEDVVQETFLKAFKQIKRFKGDSKFSTWLYRIAMNQAYDTVRSRQRQHKWLGLFPLQSEEEGLTHQAIDPRTGADAAQASDLRGEIIKALWALNPDQRTVVQLRLVQGFTTEETAAILKCKKGTVLSRLYYGCQKLKELLGDRYAEL